MTDDEEFRRMLEEIQGQGQALADLVRPTVNSETEPAAKPDPDLLIVRGFLADIREGRVTPPKELVPCPCPEHGDQKILVN
jgi:hypothetical protein